MKKLLKSLTVTSLVLSGGFLFGFSEQAGAMDTQTSKSEVSTENIGIASYEFSFYDLSDLRGTEFFTLTPGSSKNFVGDAGISSIKMPPSSSMTLYRDQDYEGKKITIKNTDESSYLTVNLNEYYIDGTDKKWNNKVGSIKTKRI